MEAAMTAVKGGCAIKRVAEEHGVPVSTLRDRISGRVLHGTKPGPKPYLSSAEEGELSSFLQLCSNTGYGRTRSDVLCITRSVAAEKGVLKGSKVTQGWWRRFCERQPELSLRRGDVTAHVTPSTSRQTTSTATPSTSRQTTGAVTPSTSRQTTSTATPSTSRQTTGAVTPSTSRQTNVATPSTSRQTTGAVTPSTSRQTTSTATPSTSRQTTGAVTPSTCRQTTSTATPSTSRQTTGAVTPSTSRQTTSTATPSTSRQTTGAVTPSTSCQTTSTATPSTSRQTTGAVTPSSSRQTTGAVTPSSSRQTTSTISSPILFYSRSTVSGAVKGQSSLVKGREERSHISKHLTLPPITSSSSKTAPRARLLTSADAMAQVEERERKKRLAVEEKERKKIEREEKKRQKEIEQKRKAEERLKKMEMKAKKVSEKQRVTKRNSSSTSKASCSEPPSKRSRLEKQDEINTDECCVCFELYSEDVSGAEWIECACGRWLHENYGEECIIDADGRERFCPMCL